MFADLPLDLYEFAVTFLPLMAVLILYGRRQKNQGFPIGFSSFMLLTALGIYLISVFHVTGSGTLWAGLRNGLSLRNVNLVPFSGEILVDRYLLNVLMLMPMGFILPLMYSRQNSLPKAALWGGSLSLLIELSQMLSGRATDIDDLIMNTLGAVIGCLLFRLVGRCLRGKKPPRKLPASSLLLVPVTVFLARFFLFDQLGFLRLISG